MRKQHAGSAIVIIIIIVLVLIGLGIGIFVLLSKNPEVGSKVNTPSFMKIGSKLENQTKSPHFVSSTPAHGEVFAASPYNVVIDFNFDIATPSEIKIEKDGKDVAIGQTTIDSTKLALRRDLPKKMEDGLYTVKYNACWPDGSCHPGQFQFEIDSKKLSEYKDMTGESTVEISMAKTRFSPEKVKIAKGTKVIFRNDEAAIHYVNTDSHPAHTHILSFNSEAINFGGSYAYTFSEIGEFPYHCSAHASLMMGRIVVVE
jgi:plastocyanin/methionine-rich copper-binding protein CopC